MISRNITGHVLILICQCLLLFFFLPYLQSWSSQLGTHEHPTPPIIFPDSDQSNADSLKPSLHSWFVHFKCGKELVHGYSRYFDPIFEPLRNKPIRLAEIGVLDGQSMRTWMSYFSNPGHVYGIGYGHKNGWQKDGVTDCSALNLPATQTGGCSLFKGDQSNLTFLEFFIKETGGNFDFIIDDASHLPSHQLFSFETLWPCVVPGGYYIIEDVETSYWRKSAQLYGYKYTNQKSLVGHMKLVADVVNRKFARGNSPLSSLYNDISSIQFGYNLIIIRKAGVEERKTYLEGKYVHVQQSGWGEIGLPFP